MRIIKGLSLLWLLVLHISTSSADANTKKVLKQPNILFIGVDDLKPTVGAYGDALAITPNIDRLSAQGTTFQQAFASVPTCGASRASLFTGIRPTSTRFVTARTKIEVDAPGATTIAKHLKDHGYYSVSIGKILHHKDDVADHWSESPWRVDGPNYHSPENLKIVEPEGIHKAAAFENYEYDDAEHVDARIAAKALDKLDDLAKKGQPFFLSVGFRRPHLPFSAPKKYWDLYPVEKITFPTNHFHSLNTPKQAHHTFGELRAYSGMPKKEYLSDEAVLQLRRGYYASVSMADEQVGRVLKRLEDLGLRENTIVVLWGDHGYQLGEHKIWNKHSNFKTSTHTPLIFSVPGKPQNQDTQAMTEFVDIFPTLCDLLGIEKPAQLQGESVANLLDDPKDYKDSVAFIQWQRGTTMFTDRYAYTEWFDEKGEFEANMLFDHQKDPDENVNVAQDPEHEALIVKLSKALNEKRLSIK